MRNGPKYFPGPMPKMYLTTPRELHDLLYSGWQIGASRDYFMVYQHNAGSGFGSNYPIPDSVYEAAGGAEGLAAFDSLSQQEKNEHLLQLYPEGAQPPTKQLDYAALVSRDIETLPKSVRQVRPQIRKK